MTDRLSCFLRFFKNDRCIKLSLPRNNSRKLHIQFGNVTPRGNEITDTRASSESG